MILVTTIFLIGMMAGRLTKKNLQFETRPGDIYEGMSVSWMRVSELQRLSGDSTKFGRLCHGYPILETSKIENVEDREMLWNSLTGCISDESVEVSESFDFRPTWAVEIWNVDHGSALLFSPEQGIAVFKSGTKVIYHAINSFPADVISIFTNRDL